MLVLDANILIRAVLGSKVLSLLRNYADRVEFLAPDTAFAESREWLPKVLERRNTPVQPALAVLDLLSDLVQVVDHEVYLLNEPIARNRIAKRDEEDWPVLAVALTYNCPIWTEDADFFGCGVATWTTDRIELYLSQACRGYLVRRDVPANGRRMRHLPGRCPFDSIGTGIDASADFFGLVSAPLNHRHPNRAHETRQPRRVLIARSSGSRSKRSPISRSCL